MSLEISPGGEDELANRFCGSHKAGRQREIAHHLNELTAEFERQAYSHKDAELLAKREFGGAEQLKEQCRDERRWALMTGRASPHSWPHLSIESRVWNR